jgi:hypothetical protein
MLLDHTVCFVGLYGFLPQGRARWDGSQYALVLGLCTAMHAGGLYVCEC